MTQPIEVHEKEPEGFSPQVHTAACYLEIDGKLLLLQRTGKSEPGKWGVPAGKLEKNETPEEAAIRELFEETGIRTSQIQGLGTLFVRKPEMDFTYHLFKVHLDQIPDVLISDEHQDYKWASSEELEKMPLMNGAMDALLIYRKRLLKKRTGAYVNAYLILKKQNQILLQLRKNTGYCDGMWSFVSGHVEDGEPATAAIIREAREEIGIELSPSKLKVVHVMHRKTDRLNVDVFFACSDWSGEIINCELEKCEKLEFFSLDALPANTIDYHQMVLSTNEFYSELGWNP